MTLLEDRKEVDQPQAPDIPEWAIKTPDQDTYQLMMFDGQDGVSIQEVDLSREEYIAIKDWLIERRRAAGEPLEYGD